MGPDQVEDIETPETEEKLPLEQAIEDATEGEETPAETPPPIPEETIKEARDMGWVPQDEWRGDPDIWKPADEFARRGKEVLPIVNSTNRRLKEQLSRSETHIEELKEQMEGMRGEFRKDLESRSKRLEGMTKAALASQREQLFKAFEAEKRKAVMDGNTDEYDRLSSEQNKAMSEFKPEADFEEEPAAAPEPKKQETRQEAPPEVNDWMGANQWFNRDPVLTALATEEHGKILEQMPGLSLSENLERVTQAVKAKFPEKFGISEQPKPNGSTRPHAPSVEGGKRENQTKTSEKGWNDLPPEAKVHAKNFFEDGLFEADKSLETAQRNYAKAYWSQPGV